MSAVLHAAAAHPSRRVLERDERLSRSLLWRLQRRFFVDEGVDAWVGQVPYYITSNPFIARAYAQVVVRFVQDQLRRGRLVAGEPLYVVELGAGAGKFTGYALREIERLVTSLGLGEVPLRYVVTDFTDRNADFLLGHPSLAPFVERGVLDFGLFDAGSSTAIELRRAGTRLVPGDVANPMVVLANYVFDSVPHDAFRTAGGALHEALVEASAELPDDADAELLRLDEVAVAFTHRPAASPYYGDARLDSLLDHYREHLGDGEFLVPTGAVRCLDALAALTGGRLLVLAADKGHDRMSELRHGSILPVVHGSISLSVNFHALAWYAERSGGQAWRQAPRDGLKSVALLFGDSLADCPETREALASALDAFGPSDYFSFHQHLRHLLPDADLDVLVAHLHLSGWDPYFLHLAMPALEAGLPTASPALREALAHGIPRVAASFYAMPDDDDVFFDLGLLCQLLARPAEALAYYRRSDERFGPCFSTCHNAGQCQFLLGDRPRALRLFQRALALAPASRDAAAWVRKLSS